MIKSKKAAAGAIRSGSTNTIDCLRSNTIAVSASDCNAKTTEKQQELEADAEKLAGQIFEHIKRNRKIVRCILCVGCRKSFAPSKMSGVAVLCRGCFAASQDKARVARTNFIDRVTNNFRIFLGVKI